MEGHLASFLELADMAAADVYRVDEGQAAELEHSSRRLLSQPGLNAGVVEAREVARRFKVLCQALYCPDFSESAAPVASDLRRTALNIDTLARRVDFGLQLKELRMRHGMTQKELALRARIDPGYESRLERFLAGPPSAEVAQQLASALGNEGIELSGAHQLLPSWQPSAGPRQKTSAERDNLLSELLVVCGKLPSEYLRFLLVQAQAVSDLVESESLKHSLE